MAKHTRTLQGDADALVAHLDAHIVRRSATASVEERASQSIGDARMLVRTYERYSFLGSNRVSLNIAVLAVGNALAVTAITAGGSQTIFWKIDTFGESNFLAKAVEALDSFG